MTPGLTPFIVAMIRTPTDRLQAANVEKLADRYEISATTARFYLSMWIGR